MNVGFTMRTEIANSAVNASVIFVHWSMMGLKDSTRTPSTAGEYKPRERETAQNRRLPPRGRYPRTVQHTHRHCKYTSTSIRIITPTCPIGVRITVSVLESFSSIYLYIIIT